MGPEPPRRGAVRKRAVSRALSLCPPLGAPPPKRRARAPCAMFACNLRYGLTGAQIARELRRAGVEEPVCVRLLGKQGRGAPHNGAAVVCARDHGALRRVLGALNGRRFCGRVLCSGELARCCNTVMIRGLSGGVCETSVRALFPGDCSVRSCIRRVNASGLFTGITWFVQFADSLSFLLALESSGRPAPSIKIQMAPPAFADAAGFTLQPYPRMLDVFDYDYSNFFPAVSGDDSDRSCESELRQETDSNSQLSESDEPQEAASSSLLSGSDEPLALNDIPCDEKGDATLLGTSAVHGGGVRESPLSETLSAAVPPQLVSLMLPQLSCPANSADDPPDNAPGGESTIARSRSVMKSWNLTDAQARGTDCAAPSVSIAIASTQRAATPLPNTHNTDSLHMQHRTEAKAVRTPCGGASIRDEGDAEPNETQFDDCVFSPVTIEKASSIVGKSTAGDPVLPGSYLVSSEGTCRVPVILTNTKADKDDAASVVADVNPNALADFAAFRAPAVSNAQHGESNVPSKRANARATVNKRASLCTPNAVGLDVESAEGVVLTDIKDELVLEDIPHVKSEILGDSGDALTPILSKTLSHNGTLAHCSGGSVAANDGDQKANEFLKQPKAGDAVGPVAAVKAEGAEGPTKPVVVSLLDDELAPTATRTRNMSSTLLQSGTLSLGQGGSRWRLEVSRTNEVQVSPGSDASSFVLSGIAGEYKIFLDEER